MTDPMQPSPEHRARMDQMRAAVRDVADMLAAAVDDLTAQGWTDEQARAIVAHLVTAGPKR